MYSRCLNIRSGNVTILRFLYIFIYIYSHIKQLPEYKRFGNVVLLVFYIIGIADKYIINRVKLWLNLKISA